MVLKIFIYPSHIANWSLGLLESMGCDRHSIRALGSFHYQLIFAYVQQVSSYLKMNNSKDHISTQFMHRSLWEISTSRQKKDKKWSIHWGMHSSIGNTWAPVKIRCIADYCKTKACSIGVVPSIGLLLLHADVLNCWSWVTVEYISVQEEDSKVEQINYVMRKVKLKLNLQNEQISIRNTREIHEIGQNSKNKHFF